MSFSRLLLYILVSFWFPDGTLTEKQFVSYVRSHLVTGGDSYAATEVCYSRNEHIIN
jgi:hypothetical protein